MTTPAPPPVDLSVPLWVNVVRHQVVGDPGRAVPGGDGKRPSPVASPTCVDATPRPSRERYGCAAVTASRDSFGPNGQTRVTRAQTRKATTPATTHATDNSIGTRQAEE